MRSETWTKRQRAKADALWRRAMELHRHPEYQLDERSPSPWVLWKLVSEEVARALEPEVRAARRTRKAHSQ
jgi:hypothetical protein